MKIVAEALADTDLQQDSATLQGIPEPMTFYRIPGAAIAARAGG